MRNSIRSSGAANIAFITGAASNLAKSAISADDAMKGAMALEGFEWLIEHKGWFWLGPESTTRIHSVVRKVISAAGQRVDIEEFHQAACRSYRYKYNDDREQEYLFDAPW